MSLPAVSTKPAAQANANGLPIEYMFKQIMDSVHKSVSVSDVSVVAPLLMS